MASKEQILGILTGESGAMNRTVLGKRLGLPTSSFQSQLDRMVKQGLLEKSQENEYTITEAGHQFALAAPPPDKLPDETPPEEPTEESLKTTEYQQFVQMGKTTGVVPQALIEQTATHIWRGGDFRDLIWVWKGITEMGIRSDLAQRWWHSWRSFLHQAVPLELVNEVGSPQTSAEKGTEKDEAAGKGKRDYILGPNDTPLRVGDGVGDLDYEDAVRLSAVRAAALARGGAQAGQQGQPATPGTMADEVVKVWNAFRETMGPQTKGKSYIVKPGEGGFIVEELEEGKPTLISTPGVNPNPSPSYFVDSEGTVQEVPPGKPVVIKQSTPTPQLGKTFIVRQTPDGVTTEEYEAGKPIIINTVPSPASTMPPMLMPAFNADGKPMTDENGNPIYGQAEQMMKWWGFWNEQRRADERHSTFVSIGQAVRENFSDGVQALKDAIAENKASSERKSPTTPEQQVFQCGTCQQQFGPPAGWAGEPIKCPTPGCGREYTKEELLG